MNFYHISLLLLVVLSTYSEGPQHAKPPEPLDSSVATVCPESRLGFLAPVLSKHEVVHVLPQNGVRVSTSAPMGDLDPYRRVYRLSKLKLRSV